MCPIYLSFYTSQQARYKLVITKSNKNMTIILKHLIQNIATYKSF